jgi:outer membrane lipoprotein-sorting protein
VPRVFGLSALSVLLAVPGAPAEPPSPQKAQAEAVLARTRDLGRRLKTFSSALTRTTETFDAKGQLTARSSVGREVLLRFPDQWQYISTAGSSKSTQLYDGKHRYSFLHDGLVRRYQDDTHQMPFFTGCWKPLLAPDRPFVDVRGIPRTCYLGKLDHNHQACDVIQVRGEGTTAWQTLLFLDGRGVPVKTFATHFHKDGTIHTTTEVVTHYALDPELPPDQFVFKLPAGARLIDGDAEVGVAEARVREESNKYLLKVGEKAPAFAVPDTAGNQLTLDGLLTGKKALVLHLWCFG